MQYHQFFTQNITKLNKVLTYTGTAYLIYGQGKNLYTPPENTLPASKELIDEVNQQAQKMGVNRPIKIYSSNKSSSHFEGVNGPTVFNSMSIILEKDIEQAPSKNFAIAHEIAHAKYNDALIVSAILSAASYPFTKGIVTPPKALWMSPGFITLYAFLAIIGYLRYAEKRADLTAAEHVSNKDIKGFIQRLEKVRTENLEYRNSDEDKDMEIIKKIYITSSGESFFDTHPFHSTRIEYLTKFIEQRNGREPNSPESESPARSFK